LSAATPPARGAVVVTGASSGIGEACALHLDARGFRVFAGVRREEDAGRLRAQASERLSTLILDVTDQRAIDASAAAVDAAVGAAGLAGLVNNAGVAEPGVLEYLSLDRLRHQLEVNVVGQIAVTQAFLPALRRARGRVVNMGSISGRLAPPFIAPYAMSKHAIEAFSDALRLELRPWGIQVALIEPGSIVTPLWGKGLATADEVLAELPEEAHHRYDPYVGPARAAIDRIGRAGAPASAVAEAVARALEARRPKTRTLVGADARLQALLRAWVPDRLRDRLVALQLKLPR
jgi:NAD(P)-dependent dehydrogenase (short-subunit alcohol dehydrogenase family)